MNLGLGRYVMVEYFLRVTEDGLMRSGELSMTLPITFYVVT